MNKEELEKALELVKEAEKKHPEATTIYYVNGHVDVVYKIYPEGYFNEPF
jgi:hypothetical protein